MSKKGLKIIQKGILGHLGHLFSTYARMKKYDKTSIDNYIYKESEINVPSVPKPESVEICKDFKTPVRSVRTEVSRPYWQRPDGSCYVCHSTESWLSIHGVTVCVRCHPPGHDRLVSRWGTA